MKLPKATIYHVFKIFKEESMVDRKDHKTWSDSKHTPWFLTGLKHSIEVDPSTSMTTLAKKCNVSFSTMSRAVNRDLDMISYVWRCCHFLTAKAKAIKAKRCSKLLSFIKHQGAGIAFVFVDKKKFTVDAEVNRRNSRVIAYNPSDVPLVFQTKNPASLMLFGATANDGSVMNAHFITASLKISTKEYLDILKNSLLP